LVVAAVAAMEALERQGGRAVEVTTQRLLEPLGKGIMVGLEEAQGFLLQITLWAAAAVLEV
jgi:hypothetical protein